MVGAFQVQVYVRVYHRWKQVYYHQQQHHVYNHIQQLLNKVLYGFGCNLACHQTLMILVRLILLISLVLYTWTFRGITMIVQADYCVVLRVLLFLLSLLQLCATYAVYCEV